MPPLLTCNQLSKLYFFAGKPKRLQTIGGGIVSFNPFNGPSRSIMFPTNVKKDKIKTLTRELQIAKRQIAVQRHLLASVGLERNLEKVERFLQDPKRSLPQDLVRFEELPKVATMNRRQLEEEIRIRGYTPKLPNHTSRTLWDIAKKNQGYLIILLTISKISKFITKNATLLLEF